jgi:hypothetical protein
MTRERLVYLLAVIAIVMALYLGPRRASARPVEIRPW